MSAAASIPAEAPAEGIPAEAPAEATLASEAPAAEVSAAAIIPAEESAEGNNPKAPAELPHAEGIIADKAAQANEPGTSHKTRGPKLYHSPSILQSISPPGCTIRVSLEGGPIKIKKIKTNYKTF